MKRNNLGTNRRWFTKRIIKLAHPLQYPFQSSHRKQNWTNVCASDLFQSELWFCLISIMEFSCLDTFQNKDLCNTLSLISIISIKKKKNRPLRLTLCFNCGTVLWHHYLRHASSSTVTDDDDDEGTAMCLFTSGITVHSEGSLIAPKDGK